MKKCPFCAEEIKDAAVVCRFCGRELEPAPAPTTNEAAPPAADPEPAKASIGWQVKLLVGLVFFSILFGIILIKVAAVAESSTAIGWTVVALVIVWASAVVVGRFKRDLVPLAVVSRLSLKHFVSSLVIASSLVLGAKVGMDRSAEKAREIAAQRKAEEHKRQKAAALMEVLEAKVAAEKWEAADKLAGQVAALVPDQPGLAEARRLIRPEIAQIRTAQAWQDALSTARRVVSDKELCDTPKEIADAWKKLRSLRKADGDWSQAVALTAKLERCRLSTERSLSEGMKGIMVQQRLDMANRLEVAMLDQGMEVEFTAGGRNKNRLTIKWALMGRAAVHKMTDGGSVSPGSFLGGLQNVGFRKVSFTDGWRFNSYYELDPPDETNGGQQVLAGLGIGSPLRLTAS